MGDRKQPNQPPKGQVKPQPPPAPPEFRKNLLEVRISDMPEMLYAIRKEVSGVIRRVAESESDPRVAARLKEIADTFAAGVEV